MFDAKSGVWDQGIYAGIGSTGIPYSMSVKQATFAFCMAFFGYRLRSGAAPGSDTSYEIGAKWAYDYLATKHGLPFGAYEKVMEVMMPWRGFNFRPNTPAYIVPNEDLSYVEKYHPAFDRLNSQSRSLMSRNTNQLLGVNFDTPVNFVSCFTPKGAVVGGTGQGLRMSADFGIKVYNFGDPQTSIELDKRVESARSKILTMYGFDPVKYVLEKFSEYLPMPLNYIKADVIKHLEMPTNTYDLVIQCNNCFCTMGSGFAKRIADRYPAVADADLATEKGKRSKLGTFSSADVTVNNRTVTFINLYGQYKYGHDLDVLYADYKAIARVLKDINKRYANARVLMPKLACGTANGCPVTMLNMIAGIFGSRATIIEN